MALAINVDNHDTCHGDECRTLPRYKGHTPQIGCCVEGLRLQCTLGNHACDWVMQTTQYIYHSEAARNGTAVRGMAMLLAMKGPPSRSRPS